MYLRVFCSIVKKCLPMLSKFLQDTKCNWRINDIYLLFIPVNPSTVSRVSLPNVRSMTTFYLALLRKQGTWDGDTGSIHCFTSRKSYLRATYVWAQVGIFIKHTTWKWHVSPFSDVPQNFYNNLNDNLMPFCINIMQYYRVYWFSKNPQNIFPTIPCGFSGIMMRIGIWLHVFFQYSVVSKSCGLLCLRFTSWKFRSMQ